MSMPTSGIISLKADYHAAGDAVTDDTQKVSAFFNYLDRAIDLFDQFLYQELRCPSVYIYMRRS